MLKDYFEVPNKPAIKSGNVLSCDFTDHETFIPQPLDFTRNTLATYVDCNGLIKVSGVSDTNLVENGTFETPVNNNQWFDFSTPTIAERSQSVAYEGNFSYHIKGDNTNQGTQASASQFAGDYVIGDTIRVRAYIYPITASFNQIKSGVSNSNRSITAAVGGLVLNQWNFIEYYAEITTASNNYVTFLISGTAGEFYLDNVSVNKVDLNVPRIDYTTEIGKAKELQKPSLLLEPQSTNEVFYSNDFSQWTDVGGLVLTSNIAKSPDGSVTADGIQDTTGGTFKRIRIVKGSLSPNSTFTASFFVKKETSEINYGGVALVYQNVSTATSYGIIDAVNGTIVNGSGSITPTFNVVDFGNYWRFEMTSTDNGSNTAVEFAIYGTLSNNGTSLGTGIGSVRTIWGAQLEQQNYATSYIPTFGSTVTRNGERARDAGSASVFNSEEGTFYAEFAALHSDQSWTAETRRMGISDNTNNNRATITLTSANGINFLYKVGGTNSLSRTNGTLYPEKFNKVAFTWKTDEFKIWINGNEFGPRDTAGNVMPANTCDEFSFDRSANTNPFYSRTRSVKVFRRVLTDSELTELTNNIV